MKKNFKKIALLISVVIVLFLSACVSNETNSNSTNELESRKQILLSSNVESITESTTIPLVSEKIENLSLWAGKYQFNEFAYPNINMVHQINIYKENDNYYAKLSVDGFQTLTRIQAIVVGNENEIEIVFNEYLPGNCYEPHTVGDVLFKLKKEDSKIYTYWDEYEPMLEENRSQGTYFEKLLSEK